MNISRSLGIGCLLCCASKVAILAFGGAAVLGGTALALDKGALPGVLCSLGLGLLGIAFHMMQTREAQAKLCPVKAQSKNVK
jgi:hypothetical protein